MTKCVFCPEVGVATTAATTSTEAFPFLCTQLGLSSLFLGRIYGGGDGAGPPCALCSSCHSLWEEVSVLYSNMQGLLNLMDRRIQQIKTNIDKGPEGSRRRGSRKRSPPPEDESMLSWWYPSVSDCDGTQAAVGVDVEIEIDPMRENEIKTEPEGDDYVVELDMGDAQGGGDGDVGEYEIFPQDEESDVQYEEYARSDPSYNPKHSNKAKLFTPSSDQTTSKRRVLTEPDPGRGKPPRKRHTWEKVQSFDDLDAAKNYLKGLNELNYNTKKEGKDFVKINYSCKFFGRCSKKAYIEIRQDKEPQINLYMTKADHDHVDEIRKLILNPT